MSQQHPIGSASSPPSKRLLLLELRAIWELGAFFSMAPLLQLTPRGDGHAVLVLPGLSASDTSTEPLRAFLTSRGYRSNGWLQGRNRGPRPGVEDKLLERLDGLYQRYGRKVSLIGWSLGGIMARELARRAPDQVRSVITLGSPFAGEPRASNAWRIYEAESGMRVHEWAEREQARMPPPVPSTAIYSRSDGIVAWQGCMEQEGPMSENIEIEGSHCGLGHNPLALYAIADRLSQPQGDWKPFERTALRALVYPQPHRDATPDVAMA